MWIAALSIAAQEVPEFHNYEFEDQAIIRSMSDNGQWAVSSSNNDGTCVTHLINLDSHQSITISTEDETQFGYDVTDDGSIVVGQKASQPAFYSYKTKSWTILPTKSGHPYGMASRITPDGKYVVGELSGESELDIVAVMWEITDGSAKLVETPGLPIADMSNKNQGMMQFKNISADGRYILGCMSYSYMPSGEDAGGCFWYVYDRKTSLNKPIGFTTNIFGKWNPMHPNLTFISEAVMSNNGRFISGKAHIAIDIEGEEYADEYEVPFLYDVDEDEFTCYDETTVSNTAAFAVSNDGVVITCTPEGSPTREWMIHSGKYWFSFAEILKQKYGMTIKDATTYSNTGTVNCISDDGLRIASFPDPYSSYVVDLPEELTTICNGIKLLGSYSVTPEEGAKVSHLKNITVTFDRNIKAVGGTNSAEILDFEGNTVYTSVGFSAEGKTLSIRFRTGTLDEGDHYKLFIPEGTIALEEDATQTNNDIYFSYTGRADEAVQMTSVYPANHSTISLIDYSTSPVLISFNTNINIADDATAYLYRNSEEQPFCGLTLAKSGNQLAIYPSTAQYLYDGSTYRIVVNKGAVTDVAGNNPSDEITLNYTGNYVRTISADDVILFTSDFDNGTGDFMQWCGDQKNPSEEMQNWDFTRGMAWGLVRESYESANAIAASHSMYQVPGESDDWLVTPQIYIPDMLCSMNFLSQSYMKDKKDVLKVIVWESNNVYNTLDNDIMAQMKAEGKVIYNKVQSAGANEEVLEGEFTKNTLSLADFAEKNIYIAFVNQNDSQSAIFLDSVEVRHDMTYLVSLNHSENVVKLSDITISGTIIGNSDSKTYDKATITLRNAEGKTIGTYTASGINLKKDAQHKFTVANPLPLKLGEANKFTLDVDLDGDRNVIKGTIKNLAFQPVKRIILEEYTGRACGNCPLGIVGMEKLEARYGDSFIPISIHTYNNDPLGSGLTNYTSLLGIDQLGAPSGMINRGVGCYPAFSGGDSTNPTFYFSNHEQGAPEGEDKVWMDYAEEEMSVPAESEINITASYNEASKSFIIPCEIKYALNASNLNVNLFTVLVEDNLSQAQQNYMSGYSTPTIGEWGLGGKYGQAVVTDYLHQDVCRNISGLTINGTGGYIPASVTAGETYKAELSIPVPSTVKSLTSCKLIVVMIDGNTGKVINAARCKYSDGTGIKDIIEKEAPVSAEGIYTLSGQKVSGTLSRGIYIINGKKTLIK